jgi:hypothetical protein
LARAARSFQNPSSIIIAGLPSMLGTIRACWQAMNLLFKKAWHASREHRWNTKTHVIRLRNVGDLARLRMSAWSSSRTSRRWPNAFQTCGIYGTGSISNQI